MLKAGKILELGIGRPAANLSFTVMQAYIHSMQRRGVGMLHTARPFSFYRKVFFDGRNESAVLSGLHGRRVVDVGCGYTPYNADSMFRACHDAGIEFYGVDPLIGTQIKIGIRERMLARATGGSANFDPNPRGIDKAIASSAQQLPFADHSIDQILSSYLLFVWIEDENLLADILNEFARVLKPGGVAKLYPHIEWRFTRFSNPRLLAALKQFEIKQRFVHGRGDPRIAPSMLSRLIRN